MRWCNTISFAGSSYFKSVISNELDNGRVKMLENNVSDVLKLDKVTIINSSILNAPFLGDIDVLFLDPEWVIKVVNH